MLDFTHQAFRTVVSFFSLHGNPVIVTMAQLLVPSDCALTLYAASRQAVKDADGQVVPAPRRTTKSPRGHFRWLVAYTLVHNPQLIKFRRHAIDSTLAEERARWGAKTIAVKVNDLHKETIEAARYSPLLGERLMHNSTNSRRVMASGLYNPLVLLDVLRDRNAELLYEMQQLQREHVSMEHQADYLGRREQAIQREYSREIEMKNVELVDYQKKLDHAEWRLRADPVLVAIYDAQEADQKAREQLLQELIPLRENYPKGPIDEIRPLPMLPELPPLAPQPRALMRAADRPASRSPRSAHAAAADADASGRRAVVEVPLQPRSQAGRGLAEAGVDRHKGTAVDRGEPSLVSTAAAPRAPGAGLRRDALAVATAGSAVNSREYASTVGSRLAETRTRSMPLSFRSIVDASALVDDTGSEYSVDALAYDREAAVSFDLHARRI
jgi:hypothetical protein